MCTIMTRDGAKFWWGIELPKDVHHLIKDIGDREWRPITYKDINARRVATMNFHIYDKRAHEEVRPCAVWVFYNEHGINDMFFKGWWIYLRTLRGDYALNFRNARKDLIMQAKQLFSCGLLPFDDDYDEVWFSAFEKKYHYPGKRKRNAIAFCHCRFDKRGYIREIMR